MKNKTTEKVSENGVTYIHFIKIKLAIISYLMKQYKFCSNLMNEMLFFTEFNKLFLIFIWKQLETYSPIIKINLI